MHLTATAGENVSKPQCIGLDFGEQKILADIDEYSRHCMNVVEDDGQPPWSFTIGLFETWSHPEFIVIGRSRATAHEMLKALATEIEENRPPELAGPDEFLLLGIRCRFLKVLPRYYNDYVGFARWYYRKRHFPPYQIIVRETTAATPGTTTCREPQRSGNPCLANHPNDLLTQTRSNEANVNTLVREYVRL
jgi:Domain of unknown function (DUF4262)